MDASPYVACMVCGAPRGGTTLLQALICTSQDAHPVIPECTYLTALVNAYDLGQRRYLETEFYFDSPEAFRAYNEGIIVNFIDATWKRYGQPKILVLRDPAMTKVVPLLAPLVSNMKFVIAVRDPKEVVASRNEVFRKQNPGAAIADEHIKYVCRQYVDYYKPVLDQAPDLGARVLWIPYEDFAAGRKLEDIERFLNTRLQLDKLWKGAELGSYPEWVTDLYYRPLSTASVGSHQASLSTDHRNLVEDETGEIYKRLCAISRAV